MAHEIKIVRSGELFKVMVRIPMSPRITVYITRAELSALCDGAVALYNGERTELKIGDIDATSTSDGAGLPPQA